jgi:hypothetical protein
MKSALIAAVVAAVVAAASGKAATIVVTSKNIKNGTIQTSTFRPKPSEHYVGSAGLGVCAALLVPAEYRGRLAREAQPVRLVQQGHKVQPGSGSRTWSTSPTKRAERGPLTPRFTARLASSPSPVAVQATPDSSTRPARPREPVGTCERSQAPTHR